MKWADRGQTEDRQRAGRGELWEKVRAEGGVGSHW